MNEPLTTIHASEWNFPLAAADAAETTRALETGQVLYLPRLAFTLSADERRFLSPQWSDGKAKNVSYDPPARQIRHTAAHGDDRIALAAMMARFANAARTLVTSMCPRYERDLAWGLTSFRPVSAAGREASVRKDDMRLHVDAFASRPVRGRRLLRVFSNINPDGAPRVWEIGEPFDAVAARFRDRIPAQWPGSAWLLEKLHITKGRRSAYDHVMLGLHDQAKLDDRYQSSTDKIRVEFPPNTTWIVFTDLVMHAALSGQYLLEQTFYLPPAAMQDEGRAPLRRLEKIYQRALA
jgi:hypothetical protein